MLSLLFVSFKMLLCKINTKQVKLSQYCDIPFLSHFLSYNRLLKSTSIKSNIVKILKTVIIKYVIIQYKNMANFI